MTDVPPAGEDSLRALVCPRCLDPAHTLVRCPYVKAVQFRPDGTIARAEFLTPADMPATPPSKKVDSGAADGDDYPRKGG